MDDDKYYTIQVKGEAHRFKPVPPEDYERIALVQSMTVDSAKYLKVVTQALSNAAMGDAWNKITDLWVSGGLTTPEATVDILRALVTRQSEDKTKAAKKVPAKRTPAKRTAPDAE